MIRKPDTKDFRESDAVTAIRDAGTLAVEGAKGVRDGTAMFVGRAMMGLMAFGFVMAMAIHIGPVMLLLALAGGAAWLVRRNLRDADNNTAWHNASTVTGHVAAPISPERYELSVGAVGRRAATIAVPAILLFPTTSFVTFMMPFTLGGITYLALAMLLVARLFADRTVLRYDEQALTVTGLLGEATILWIDVADVAVRKASIFNLRVLFTSGARRNLVVFGRVSRLGGPNTLYIPVDLIGLDREALQALVTRMLTCAAGGGDVIPPAELRDASAHAVVAMPARLRSDGTAGNAPPIFPLRPTPWVPALPTSPAASDAPFDPDAIIARYLAERDQPYAEQNSAADAPRRRAFGRKTV